MSRRTTCRSARVAAACSTPGCTCSTARCSTATRMPVGTVDDLELDGIELGLRIDADAPPPKVTAILSGQVLATRIFGGAPPRSRLQEIPWTLVVSVGTTVRLASADMSFDARWVERWVREHIIARIPGGRHAAQWAAGLRVSDADPHKVGTVVDVRLTIAGDPAHSPPTPTGAGPGDRDPAPSRRSGLRTLDREDAAAPSWPGGRTWPGWRPTT